MLSRQQIAKKLPMAGRDADRMVKIRSVPLACWTKTSGGSFDQSCLYAGKYRCRTAGW